MRLRFTALPSFLVTVNPKRGPQILVRSGARGFASIRQQGMEERTPPRMARKSDRFLIVSTATGGVLASIVKLCADHEPTRGCRAPEKSLGRQALATFGAAAGQNFLATDGHHALAKAMAAFAHEAAGLICAFHATSPRSSKCQRPHERTMVN